jgi:hypothetical protein
VRDAQQEYGPHNSERWVGILVVWIDVVGCRMQEEKDGERDEGNRQRPPSVDECNRENQEGEKGPGERGAVHDVAENPGSVEIERIPVGKSTDQKRRNTGDGHAAGVAHWTEKPRGRNRLHII